MALRKPRILQGERVLKYFDILKAIDPNYVLGHIAGPDLDFEFEIRRTKSGNGVFGLIRHKTSRSVALDILQKEKDLILKRTFTDDGQPHWVKYKEGQFYVKRDPDPRITPALNEAISKGTVPERFGENLVDWGFILFKGRPKQPKKK